MINMAFYLNDDDRRYFFKLETMQRAKSFKIRGAMNKMLTLTEEEKQRGSCFGNEVYRGKRHDIH